MQDFLDYGCDQPRLVCPLPDLILHWLTIWLSSDQTGFTGSWRLVRSEPFHALTVIDQKSHEAPQFKVIWDPSWANWLRDQLFNVSWANKKVDRQTTVVVTPLPKGSSSGAVEFNDVLMSGSLSSDQNIQRDMGSNDQETERDDAYAEALQCSPYCIRIANGSETL